VTDDKSLKLLTAPRQAYYAGTRNRYPDVYRIDEKININITNCGGILAVNYKFYSMNKTQVNVT